jgi:alkylation response protein AidB-like acyl-CoA dehydrogenase
VFVESFVKGLIDLFSEVRTSRLSLGLALAGMALLILAAVLEYCRQKQRERVNRNSPEQPIHQDRNGLTQIIIL